MGSHGGSRAGGSGGGGGTSGASIFFSQAESRALNVLQGNRGVAAFDTDGNLIGASNKTEKNGALKLGDKRLMTAESLMFTTGARDANAVVPSQRYAETFANSQASSMKIVRDNITYQIDKTADFDSTAFIKNAQIAHSTAQRSLKRKADIINKAQQSGKMSREESIAQKKKANKEYAEQINSFYKNKSNQRRYGFTVTHN